MVTPRIAKASDVLDEGKDAFHNLLGDVRRCRDAHGKATVTVQAEWSGYGAKFFAFVVRLEGIVLHRDVEFGKELVSIAARKNILNTRDRVDLALDGLVEGAKVANPVDTTVLLRSNEGA